MRCVLFISFTGVLVGGCAGPDTIRPPTEPSLIPSSSGSLSSASGTQRAGETGVLDDAIDRLVPALGPSGNALGAPLRHLRDGDRLDAALIDATLRQLAALQKALPPECVPDADALAFALGELRDAAGK
jgi:hypothetical protein